MKIIVDPAITLVEVRHMAESIGATLRSDGVGGLVITPIAAERHGNGHVIKLPHHQGQFRRASLPTSPEAA